MSELTSEQKAEQVQENTGKRNWKGFVVRIFGSLLALALLFYFLPRDKLLLALNAFSIELWVAGVSSYICLHLIGVAKWRMLINAAGGNLTFSQAVRCYYYGLFGNTFLPSVVGGDFIRAGLAMKLSKSKSSILMGSIVDRTIDSLGLALVAGIGALLIPMNLDEDSRNIFWGFALVLAIAFVVLIIVISLLPVKKLTIKWKRKLVKVRNSSRLLLKSWKKVLIALLAVILLQASQVLMNTWLGRLAKMVNVSFLVWLFVWPVAKLSAMAPLTQGGIGVREAVQGTLFIPFGVSMEKAVATGLMFQAIIITGNLLGGVVALVMGRVSAASSEKDISKNIPNPLNIQLILGFSLLLFFIANVLMLATGTGAVSSNYLQWMSWLPGYNISFIGSLVGILYGATLGYSISMIMKKLPFSY